MKHRVKAVPTWFTGIKYDAEKEEKYLQDNKQKELARIEEALQKAAEKGTELIIPPLESEDLLCYGKEVLCCDGLYKLSI